MTIGTSPSRIETHEFVVPKSIPMTRSIACFLQSIVAPRGSRVGPAGAPDPVLDAIILGRQLLRTLELRQRALFHACLHVNLAERQPQVRIVRRCVPSALSEVRRFFDVALAREQAMGHALEI